MRRLKLRRVPDTLQNQTRSHRLAIARTVYLAGLAGLAIWVGDLFFGGMLYLRSEGLVLGEPGVIAAEFPVTVRDVVVREGDMVQSGQVAVVVSSQSVAERIANLATELATRETRVSELRIRTQMINSITEAAENRQRVASDARKELESLLQRGFLSLDKRTAAVESEFRSQQELEKLRAEKRGAESEIETLKASFALAESAISDLRRLYDEGRMRAPIDGVVSRLAADRGAVVRAGDPLIEIYGKQRFVLAYLPTGGLYDVAPGDRVKVKAGFRTFEGVVTRIEPVAAALPREFQQAFKPVERQQVIRVEFAGSETPPLFAKVKLRSPDVLPSWMTKVWNKWQQSSSEAMVAGETASSAISGS